MSDNRTKTARQSGFELVRIIAMMMIVANHMINHGIMKVTGPEPYALWVEMSPLNRAVSAFISCGGRIGVAVFFMITGYFLAEREKISPKSAGSFLARVHFCGAVMLAIFLIVRQLTGYGADNNLVTVFRQSLMTPAILWWFAMAYFVLLFLAPSINVVVKALGKKAWLILLVIYVWHFFYNPGAGAFEYYNFIKAVFFYMMGVCVRTFETDEDGKIKTGGFSSSLGGMSVHVIIFAALWLLSGVLMFDVIQDTKELPSLIDQVLIWTPNEFLNNILIPLDGLSLLLIGKIRFSSKIVNKIAGCTFSVYLFHEYPYFKGFLWHNILKTDIVQYSSPLFPVFILLDILVIFAAGILLETIRQYLGKILFNSRKSA